MKTILSVLIVDSIGLYIMMSVKNMNRCPFCHNTNISDDWVYCCPQCGTESCPDCAERCLCSWEEEQI